MAVSTRSRPWGRQVPIEIGWSIGRPLDPQERHVTGPEAGRDAADDRIGVGLVGDPRPDDPVVGKVSNRRLEPEDAVLVPKPRSGIAAEMSPVAFERGLDGGNPLRVRHARTLHTSPGWHGSQSLGHGNGGPRSVRGQLTLGTPACHRMCAVESDAQMPLCLPYTR